MEIKDLKKINDYLWEIPKSFREDMRVPARIFATHAMLDEIFRDRSTDQLVNLTTLPGITKFALAMPDMHEGYGAPIGGVFATDKQSGIISPGAVGYDVNCGVRLLRSKFRYQEIKKYLPEIADKLFQAVPSGVGRGGKFRLSRTELDKIFVSGARAAVQMGYGDEEDLEHCEENGTLGGADPEAISDKAKTRGKDQLGTLGSGNHFLEIARVDKIFDKNAASAFGFFVDALTISIHCGSRGLGHQVATDYIRKMVAKLEDYKIVLPDRELACAPFSSKEGQLYFKAMAGAANFAWANRHMIAHLVRSTWSEVLKSKIGETVDLPLVYDVAHNMAKIEKHKINGKETEFIVHRKGATRAFPSSRRETPKAYKNIGHPVLIPGTMGTASYVLVGTESSLESAFGSSCHGAGRRMSRSQAKRIIRGSELRKQLEAQGIIVRCDSDTGLAEEAPSAYKDVENVVDVVQSAGIAKKVVRLKPVAVIKGG